MSIRVTVQIICSILLSTLMATRGFGADGDELKRFDPSWPAEHCRLLYGKMGGKPDVSPLSLLKRIAMARARAESSPVETFQDLIADLGGTWRAIGEQRPLFATVLSKVSFNAIGDSITLLERINSLLFAHSYQPANGGNKFRSVSWSNTGIASYIQTQLIHDPVYRKAMHTLLRRLAPTDRAVKRETASTDFSVGLLAGDIHGDALSKVTKDFNLIEEMTRAAQAALPEGERRDKKRVLSLVYKMLLYFHDDVQHFPRANAVTQEGLTREGGPFTADDYEVFQQIIEMTPMHYSVAYSDWSNSTPPREMDALEYLHAAMSGEFALGVYNPQAARYGNYHYNAAAAVHGLALDGLFQGFPFRSAAFSLVQKQMAILYRRSTASGYRHGQDEQRIDQDIQSQNPKLAERFIKGSLTFKDSMGAQSASGQFQGGYFNTHLQDPRALDALAVRLGLNPEDAGVRENLRLDVYYRQLMYLQTYRTIRQHAEGGKIAANIRNQVYRTLSAED